MKPSKTRTVKVPQVMWAKVTGADVLEGPTEFLCSYIPIVAVTGEEWHLGEESYRSSRSGLPKTRSGCSTMPPDGCRGHIGAAQSAVHSVNGADQGL